MAGGVGVGGGHRGEEVWVWVIGVKCQGQFAVLWLVPSDPTRPLHPHTAPTPQEETGWQEVWVWVIGERRCGCGSSGRGIQGEEVWVIGVKCQGQFVVLWLVPSDPTRPLHSHPPPRHLNSQEGDRMAGGVGVGGGHQGEERRWRSLG